MNLVLEIVEPGLPPRRLNVSRSLATIGRSANCDVRIDSEVVSSRHARIKRYQDQIVVEDLGSTNGLLINGDAVSGATRVCDGDIIQLGSGGPVLTVIAGAGVGSGSVRAGRRSGGGQHARGASPARIVLIASALIAGMLFLAAGAAALWWFAGAGRNGLEISSISDPRLSQAVGMVICGADLKVDGQTDEVALGGGTAFAVSKHGHLVTNRHVVEGFHVGTDAASQLLFESLKETIPADQHDQARAYIAGLVQRPRVWVALDGQILDAQVKMISENYDLAVLLVDRKELPHFTLSVQKVDRLTEVSAIGFPGAASATFSEYEDLEKLARATSGKSIRRFFTPSDLEFTQTRGYVSRLVEKAEANHAGKIDWIQHTASFSQGNSGGPLCLENGLVVGINSIIINLDANMKFSFSVGQIREELEAVTGKLHWR